MTHFIHCVADTASKANAMAPDDNICYQLAELIIAYAQIGI